MIAPATLRPIAVPLMALLMAGSPAASLAQGVQVSNLSDMPFGSLSMTGADQSQSESVCVYSGLLGGRYSVTGSGSGSGGAFVLTNGSATLPYEVQWSSTAGQTSGSNLVAGTALSGQVGTLACTLGQVDASMTVIFRGTRITAARAGSYTGTLTILIGAN